MKKGLIVLICVLMFASVLFASTGCRQLNIQQAYAVMKERADGRPILLYISKAN